MTEHGFLTTFLLDHQYLGYALAFLFMVFEGDAPLFVFGFLAHEGAFNPGVLFLFLYSGTVIGDAMWYFLGRRVSNVSFIARWANRLASPLDDHIQNHPIKTIFFSQFAYGIHHAIWIRAGLIKAPIRYLVKIDILSSIVWVLVIGGLGYASSATLLPIGKYVKYAELILLVAFLAFMVLQHYLSKLSKKQL